MQGLFFIPSSLSDKQKLLDDIVKRNKGSAAIDICYAIAVVNAFHEEKNKTNESKAVEVSNG